MSKQTVKPMVQYHPDLETVEGAYQDHDQLYSDHIPIMASVPMDGSSSLNIVSWNVLEYDNANGFANHNGDTESKYGESSDQKDLRHQRIVKAIGLCAAQQKPDFITLQEIVYGGELCKRIEEDLYEKGYALAKHDDPTFRYNHNLIFYRKETIKEQPHHKCTEAAYIDGGKQTYIIRGYGAIFNDMRGKKIKFTTTHHEFDKNITFHEKSIEAACTLGEGDDKVDVAIIAGDFNGSIAPLDDSPRNIVTSVASGAFARHKEMERRGRANNAPNTVYPFISAPTYDAIQLGLDCQNGWSIDGCFYAGVDGVIKQSKVQHLDSKTGDVKEAPALDCASMNDFQKREVEEMRPIISVAPEFQEAKLFIDKSITMQEYEQRLQDAFPGCKVRRAVNLNNEKGVAIIINQPLFQGPKGQTLGGINLPKVLRDDVIEYNPRRNIYEAVLSVKDANIGELERYLAEVAKFKGKSSDGLCQTYSVVPVPDGTTLSPVGIGVITAAILSLVSTAVMVPLEMTGTTAISTSAWMMKDIIAQDAIIAIAAGVLLSLSGIAAGVVSQRSRS